MVKGWTSAALLACMLGLVGCAGSAGLLFNNTIVVEDPFASTDHAVLTFRGRAWYVEDRDSTNGTFVNGSRVAGVAPLGFGDIVQVGQVRFRLERARR